MTGFADHYDTYDPMEYKLVRIEEADRLAAVVLAADFLTRGIPSEQAFEALCRACERITDAELQDLAR